MILFPATRNRLRRRLAMSLVEVMVASAIGSIVMAAVATLWIFGARSFVGLGKLP